LKEQAKGDFELVAPSVSILAEPPVAVVDRVVKRKGTEAVAKGYVEYLYSEAGQEIAAKNFYRPRLESVAKKYSSAFPKLELFTVDQVFGGWGKAQPTHFGEGGSFDQIVAK
jgi:sulfate transport system substrate-binding protein